MENSQGKRNRKGDGMKKRMRNKKGFLFGGIDLVPSIFIVIALINIGISQLPGVKKSFRRKKAVTMCQETGAIDCQAMVDSWNDADVLAYIKDDDPATGNGGLFIDGTMNP